MGRRIFFSYSSTDVERATSLSDDLAALGHDVWRDEQLSGGQEWWDTIVAAIRDCEVFLVALSGATVRSTPCAREREYAEALGKTILPVQITDDVTPKAAPPSLASVEWADYREPSSRSLARLHRVLESIPPSPPPPDPLPTPPLVPLSYLSGIAAAISRGTPLAADEQYALVFKLKDGLANPDDAKDAHALMIRLRQRPEILAVVAQEIDESLATRPAAGTQGMPPPPPPSGVAAPQPPAQPSAPSAGALPRKRRWLLAVIGLALLGLVGAGIAFALLRDGGDDDEPFTYGDDDELDALWDACAAGDLGACDQLYADSPAESDYEDFGSTCGDTVDPMAGSCAGEPGGDEEPFAYGDDAALDALWDACGGGDLGACDQLYADSAPGSEYEQFGSTCGGTGPPTSGSCTPPSTDP